MEKVKIGVKEVLAVTPEKPRIVPLFDPRQPECVSVLCSRQNRLRPDLPYTVHLTRDYDNHLFTIYARYKEGRAPLGNEK